MLRREIGDSAFFRGIRAYYAAHRHGNALTADLERAFERSSGRPLGWFFDQWMRRPGYAEVDATWSWNAKTQRLSVTVRQGARVAPYRLSLAVDVTTAGGSVKRVRVTVPARREATILVPVTLTAKPSAVMFDGDVSLLGVLRP
jgi:aminopeptidase N